MNWTLLPGAERVHVYNIVRHLLVQRNIAIAPTPISSLLLRPHVVVTNPARPRLFSTSHGVHLFQQSGSTSKKPGERYALRKFSFPHTTFRGLARSSPIVAGTRSFSQSHVPATSWLRHLYSRGRRKDGLQLRQLSFTRQIAKKAKGNQTYNGKGNTPLTKGQDAGEVDTGEKHLFDRLPELTQRFHRPTKEELLAAATGFWSRLRVRFKWFSIRSLRPFNSDDISAFFSWILVGHVIWILVGTTTFFSLLIFTVNTVFAQETLARWIGNYLTKSSGIKVVFESAIVPKWKDGVITFTNVFISRRPGQSAGNVTKGSQSEAAAEAAAAERSVVRAIVAEEEDTNYTQYDLTFETVNVTLSFAKWFNGKGLLRDVEIKGVRGVIDRTHLVYGTEYVNPRTFKHQHLPGDFEIESFKLEDLLVSIYQPRNFRPFSVSVFSADLPQLRKQWLFYDLLSANHVSGSFDESLFTIHPRQVHNYTGAQLNEGAADEDHTHWKKQSRIRIDGLKIDHLNRGVEGPFSWIHEGNVDIVADIMFPVDNDPSLAKVIADFYERMEDAVTSTRNVHPPLQPQQSPDISNEIINNSSLDTSTTATLTPDPTPATPPTDQNHNPNHHHHHNDNDNRFLILDLRIHLNSVHAFVPIFTRDLSYVNNALIRPIVAYINSKKQFIPINCRVVKRASEFDGSWTLYDSGLMEDLNREAYEAFARDITDDQARMRRIKKVGLWSLQLAVQALFLGLAGHLA